MHKIIKALAMLVIWQICITVSFASSIENPTQSQQDQNTRYYNKIAINQIGSFNSPANRYKIVISEKKSTGLGATLWEITEKLPITSEDCAVAYADPCDASKNELYNGACYSPCIAYGPEFAGFNEKTGSLYFTASSASIGTGGGPYFLFVADINKKEIKYITSIFGPLESELSPAGNYLLLSTNSSIRIFNTRLKTIERISEKNIWARGQERLNYISNIKWLSDSRFSYTVAAKHDKFQRSNDETKKVIYDIPSKKIIDSRLLSKTEYDKISKS